MRTNKAFPKSAKECMKDAMLAALVETLGALRKENVDNALIREVKAIHGNTTFNDLPECARTALHNSVDAAFARLSTEGYVVTTRD